jgi:hypothetical protein
MSLQGKRGESDARGLTAIGWAPFKIPNRGRCVRFHTGHGATACLALSPAAAAAVQTAK